MRLVNFESRILTILLASTIACAALPAYSDTEISGETFGCIRDMTPVRGFYVDNLEGNLDATLKVAHSPTGGRYPAGSVVQLVPTEVMVKREEGFSPPTNDWEFFELAVGPEGSEITTRGFASVVNRFGGNCFACHIKAKPQWDMICEKDHGCDPIPLTTAMARALQKTDPRCEPATLSDEEKTALQALATALEQN